MQLVTLAEVKSWLGIDVSDNSKDLNLNIYIDGISELVEGMIGRDILAQDYIEKYEGTNSNALILKHYPVNSVVAVKYVLDGAIQQELTDTEYDINSKSGILYRDLAWWKQGSSSLMSGKINFPRRHIRIEYNAGFIEVPGDLKLLVLDLIKENIGIDNSEGAKKGLKSYSISDVKMEWKGKENIKFNEAQLSIINKYRGVRI